MKSESLSIPGGGMLMLGCRIGRKPGDIRVNKTEYSSSRTVSSDGDKENDCSKVESAEGSKDNKLISDLKCSLNSYFGAETRITKGGERFQVGAMSSTPFLGIFFFRVRNDHRPGRLGEFRNLADSRILVLRCKVT